MGSPKDGEAYLRSLPRPMREIAAALRDLVQSAAPELEEKIKYSAPHYDLQGNAGTVVYIADASHHVNLGFYDGAKLQDPNGWLEGTGKRLRHVKVRSVTQARDVALRSLVQEAVRHRLKIGKPPKGY